MSGEGASQAATEVLSSSSSDLVANGKNSKKIKCERCGSLVLSPGAAVLKQREVCLLVVLTSCLVLIIFSHLHLLQAI